MINAQEITFGIEIETTIPATAGIMVGPHGRGFDVPEMPGWKADSDPSIRSSGDRIPCEFVSPIYKGIAGMHQLIADINKIKAIGATVNQSCGLHVHIGFDKSNRDNATKLATLVANFEKAIYAATGTKNRERGRWCNGLQRHGNANAALQQAGSYRYHVVNFATGSKPTVEFRAFAGSLNISKIVGYVALCIGIVERACNAKRVTNWTAKTVSPTSPIHRKGEGQTALTRLFYQLGWIKGRTDHTYGNVIGDGMPSLTAIKKAIMKMARKYDSQQ